VSAGGTLYGYGGQRSDVKPTRTLLRGLEVLEVLAASSEPLGPTSIAQAVGLDKATISRLLFTLCEAGYARQEGNGSYRLTGKILQLGSGVSLDPELREIARPHLVELRDVTDETVHLGVRDGNHVVYIDKIEGSHPVRLVSAVGQVMPLHTTALGKSALAWMDDDEREPLLSQLELVRRTEHSIGTLEELGDELERTRERGFSIDDRENEDHAVCVGAPIFDAHQRVVGMISVSGPSYRISERVDELGEHCRKASEAISGDLNDRLSAPR
jgi:DNA-binding IclR family transcriptional regulator